MHFSVFDLFPLKEALLAGLLSLWRVGVAWIAKKPHTNGKKKCFRFSGLSSIIVEILGFHFGVSKI